MLVVFVVFFQFCGNEFGIGVFDDFFVEVGDQFVKQWFVVLDMVCFQNGGLDGYVGFCQVDIFIDVLGGVVNFEV